MEITYIGHSCFKIKGKDVSVVIDPYDPKMIGYSIPKLSGDIVLSTHNHGDHNHTASVTDSKIVITTAGEYEVSDTFVYGYKTYHDSKNGSERGSNIIYQILIDDFSILHLGDLGHVLSSETLEKISNVDVLLIPVGGYYTIDAKTAVNVISDIEPSIIVPMHYQTPDLKLPQKLQELKEFIDEMGMEPTSIKKEDKLKLLSRSDVPEESVIYVLQPQH